MQKIVKILTIFCGIACMAVLTFRYMQNQSNNSVQLKETDTALGNRELGVLTSENHRVNHQTNQECKCPPNVQTEPEKLIKLETRITQRPGFKISASDLLRQPLASIFDISLLGCYKECNKREKCMGITYSRRALFCKMYGQLQMINSGDLPSPGLVQKDIGDSPQLVATKVCSEHTCNTTECPQARSYRGMTIRGNMRNINARIAYFCDNFFTVGFSTCSRNGIWSSMNTTCVTYSYEYAGPNTSGTTKSPLFVLHNTFLDACLKKCNETTGCLGVNFISTNNTCISTHKNKTKWAEVENSNYYFNIKYPMTLHRKNGLRYNFTFTEGVEFCESLGTTIASEMDLRLAYKLGFSRCACGWVDRGVSMLVLQTVCGYFREGVGQCWEQKHFDLFCKNINFVNV